MLERVNAIDWGRISGDLDAQGSAVTEGLLTSKECETLVMLYSRPEKFRSRIVMSRHNFGRGEYQYFRYPLPGLIEPLRRAVDPHLVPIANRWNMAMGIEVSYPATHAEFLGRCHQAGQDKPTPLILKYGAGDYNCLH